MLPAAGVASQVRYFKTLPNSMSAVRDAAARMAETGLLPDHEQLQAEAAEAVAGLTARGHKHSTRKHHAALTAA